MSEYTLIIPSNLLFQLQKWDKNLSVQQLKAQGSQGSTARVYDFQWGKVQDTLQTKAVVKHTMSAGEKTISWIWDQVSNYVPGVNISELYYVERNCKLGNPDWRTVGLKFESRTIHPELFSKMSNEDGGFPMSEIYELLTAIKKTIMELSPEMAKGCKGSFLILTETNPPEVKTDGSAIYALQRPNPVNSYMEFIKETSKFWKLVDFDYKTRGGPKV